MAFTGSTRVWQVVDFARLHGKFAADKAFCVAFLPSSCEKPVPPPAHGPVITRLTGTSSPRRASCWHVRWSRRSFQRTFPVRMEAVRNPVRCIRRGLQFAFDPTGISGVHSREARKEQIIGGLAHAMPLVGAWVHFGIREWNKF